MWVEKKRFEVGKGRREAKDREEGKKMEKTDMKVKRILMKE